MNDLARSDKEWQAEATAAAIAGARKIILGSPSFMNTPVGRLGDSEWGWIIAAVIFAWIETRVRQAISEGRDNEEMVRSMGLPLEPRDAAVVRSILPALADQAGIDWCEPLSAWSKDTMTSFLMLAWRLIGEAELVRDHGPGKILKPAEFDPRTGDPIPF
jgi:hypothetical protein